MDNKSFKEELKVSSEDILRSEIMSILRGEKTIKAVLEAHKKEPEFPQDIKTIKRKISKFINEEDEEIKILYNEYQQKKATPRPRGYDYIPEIFYMLEHDLSQRKAAKETGVDRNALKEAIKRVDDLELKEILTTFSNRHGAGRNCQSMGLYEKEKIQQIIDKYKQKDKEADKEKE